MNLDHLPPLRDVLEVHGLAARKSFGQHFLFDLNLTRKIARLAGPFDEGVVIEVGPGPGGLTRALLEAGAQVIAVEKDDRFLPILADLADAAEGRLSVVHADALSIDEDALIAEYAPESAAATRVVSNLPYNVGTPLLIKWLVGPFRPRTMTLMFQKEVADRIVAAAGSDAYGRLSVIAQATCDASMAMTVPARAFAPPPKVDSAVVALTSSLDRPSPPLLAALQVVTAAAFGQRRKMLRSSLKSLGGAALCAEAGIDADVRAETVPVNGFLALAEIVNRRAGA